MATSSLALLGIPGENRVPQLTMNDISSINQKMYFCELNRVKFLNPADNFSKIPPKNANFRAPST